jgi:pilus assembly protein CpaE
VISEKGEGEKGTIMAPSQQYTIVVIDSDADSINQIVKYINNLGNHAEVDGVATSFESGFELIHKKKPKVVIMEVEKEVDLSIQRIKMVLERFPQVSIFATSEDKSSDTILKVMKAGADEYILRPISEADLDSALQKHGRLWITKTVPEEETGAIITMFSPKGGVGVTTVAINLATHIHEITKKSTLVVDLDLNAGDASTFFNIKPSYTISDVTTNMSRLDKSFLKGVITRHESGVHILAEPQRVEEATSIMGDDIRKVMGLLSTMFEYIIIDTEAAVDQRTTAALEMSDLILMVFVMSLPGIKNMQRYLRYLEEKGFGKDKIQLIVNRYIKKGDIRIEDAEKALNHKISWTIPNDFDSAMSCLNKGLPLNMCSPRSKVNGAIKDLAEAMIKLKSKGE